MQSGDASHDTRRGRQLVLLAVWVYVVEIAGIGALGILGLPGLWVLARRRIPFALPACVLLALGAWLDPLGRPNHHFVLLYLVGMWGLTGSDRTAARWLYAALMAAATLQKLASPAFRDGSFVAYLVTTGGIPEVLFEVWTPAGVVENQAAVDVGGIAGAQGLRGPPGLAWIGLLGAWAILAVEAVLAGLALRGHRAFGPLAVTFVVLLPVVRFEWVFACILAVLTSLATVGRSQRVARVWALAKAVLACVGG